MSSYTKSSALVLLALLLSGCATIMTGPMQRVPITSNPSGAVAKVDGTMAAVTPTIFTLERKTDHTIEISKEGYRTATVILKHTLSGATAGNLLVGGIIGAAVDGMSGAMFKLVPERVDVNLEKAEEIKLGEEQALTKVETPVEAQQLVLDPKVAPIAP